MQRAMRGKPRTTIDGFTPEQRFFLAYARARLTVLRPEATRMMLATDPHSPGRFRVNGPLSHMPEFAQAFGCVPGDAMARPDSSRARIGGFGKSELASGQPTHQHTDFPAAAPRYSGTRSAGSDPRGTAT